MRGQAMVPAAVWSVQPEGLSGHEGNLA